MKGRGEGGELGSRSLRPSMAPRVSVFSQNHHLEGQAALVTGAATSQEDLGLGRNTIVAEEGW
jgi:hypothetical protein